MDEPTRALFKLPETAGLLVIGVAPGSPAAGRFGQGDILLKLGDQLLVNREQLRTLIRGKKPGDAVTFTISRGGREETVVVKLAASPSRPAPEGFLRLDGPVGFNDDLLRNLTERSRHMLGENGPDRALFDRAAADTTVTLSGDDFAPGLSIVTKRSVSRPEGRVTVMSRDGKKTVTVKDKDGKVIVEGELNDATRAKLPDWAKDALDAKPATPKPGAAPDAPVAEYRLQNGMILRYTQRG